MSGIHSHSYIICKKTARLIHSMIITAIGTRSKTRLAAKCMVGNMTGPKQSIIHFVE